MRRTALPFLLSLGLILSLAAPAAAIHVNVQCRYNIVSVLDAIPEQPITVSVFREDGLLKATSTQLPDLETGGRTFFLTDWNPDADYPAIVAGNIVTVQQGESTYSHAIPILRIQALDKATDSIRGLLWPRMTGEVTLQAHMNSLEFGTFDYTATAPVKANGAFTFTIPEGNIRCNDSLFVGFDDAEFSIYTFANVPGLIVLKNTSLALLTANARSRFQASLYERTGGALLATSIVEPMPWLEAGVFQFSDNAQPLFIRKGNAITVNGPLANFSLKVNPLNVTVEPAEVQPPLPAAPAVQAPFIDITASTTAGTFVALTLLYSDNCGSTYTNWFAGIAQPPMATAGGLGTLTYTFDTTTVGGECGFAGLDTVIAMIQRPDGNYIVDIWGELLMVDELLTYTRLLPGMGWEFFQEAVQD